MKGEDLLSSGMLLSQLTLTSWNQEAEMRRAKGGGIHVLSKGVTFYAH